MAIVTQAPVLYQGENVSGRRILTYWTACPRCARLVECKKKRMPLCEEPGWIHFCFKDGTGGVRWSGVITLKDIAARTKEYLEVEEEDLPSDVAVPPVQLEMEL